MTIPPSSIESAELASADKSVHRHTEAFVGMGAVAVGSLMSFAGAAVEAANGIYVQSGLINIAPEQKHSGKELMLTGGLMVFAGITSWLRGIRDWQ